MVRTPAVQYAGCCRTRVRRSLDRPSRRLCPDQARGPVRVRIHLCSHQQCERPARRCLPKHARPAARRRDRCLFRPQGRPLLRRRRCQLFLRRLAERNRGLRLHRHQPFLDAARVRYPRLKCLSRRIRRIPPGQSPGRCTHRSRLRSRSTGSGWHRPVRIQHLRDNSDRSGLCGRPGNPRRLCEAGDHALRCRRAGYRRSLRRCGPIRAGCRSVRGTSRLHQWHLAFERLLAAWRYADLGNQR